MLLESVIFLPSNIDKLLTSAVEAKTHHYTLRVDVVPPEQFQSSVNLGKVGMCLSYISD